MERECFKAKPIKQVFQHHFKPNDLEKNLAMYKQRWRQIKSVSLQYSLQPFSAQNLIVF